MEEEEGIPAYVRGRQLPPKYGYPLSPFPCIASDRNFQKWRESERKNEYFPFVSLFLIVNYTCIYQTIKGQEEREVLEEAG